MKIEVSEDAAALTFRRFRRRANLGKSVCVFYVGLIRATMGSRLLAWPLHDIAITNIVWCMS